MIDKHLHGQWGTEGKSWGRCVGGKEEGNELQGEGLVTMQVSFAPVKLTTAFFTPLTMFDRHRWSPKHAVPVNFNH